MRPICSLLVYVLVVFLGGALLAPWLYWLVQSLAPGSHLAANPFHRFVDRSLLGLAVIGIWPLFRSLRATSWREVGLPKPAGQWNRLAAGFALGFVSLALLAVIALSARARQFNANLTTAQLCHDVASAAGTAVIVSVIEEVLFRGAIFGALRKFWDWRTALLVSSMIYALTHFFEKADIAGPITWFSGLDLLPRMLGGFVKWRALVPGFFNLTLAGAMLAFAYQRTGSLYFSIGLHAGWIFWLKSYGVLTAAAADVDLWLWGSGKLIDGWLALAMLILALVVLGRLLPANPKAPGP